MIYNSYFFFVTEDQPPQVAIQTANGYSTIGPANELLVYPGSILHLDCVFNRKLGNPEWITDREGKIYPKGMCKPTYIKLVIIFIGATICC